MPTYLLAFIFATGAVFWLAVIVAGCWWAFMWLFDCFADKEE